MYLIIDEQHRVYQTAFISGYLRSQLKQGNLSIINTTQMKGMDITGDWSDIQDWDSSFRTEE